MLYLFDELEEFQIERDKTLNDPNCVPHLVGLVRQEHNSKSRLRTAFEHVLTLFIETSFYRIVLIESHEEARQRNGVVSSLFAKAGIRRHPQPCKLVDLLDVLNPRTELTLLVFR